MYLIAKNKYKFELPVSLQRNHLLDIWHLDKAHWFTLCGVSIGKVYSKTPTLVKFDLHRFGNIKQVHIRQSNECTEVDLDNFKLRFTIEESDRAHHYLHVSLFSTQRSLRLLWPLIQLVFFLTVVEDIIYYSHK